MTRLLVAFVLFALYATLGYCVGGCRTVAVAPAQPGPHVYGAQTFDLARDCAGIACPSLPASCAGPWSNQGRPDAGACPAPGDGVTVVLGRFNDIRQYINCPGFLVLNLSDYTVEENDQYIACAAAGKLGGSILVASPLANIPRPPTASRTPVELCQLAACGCRVSLGSGQGARSVGARRCQPMSRKVGDD